MNSQQIDCAAIIGVGLIGGSFGMALKKRGLVRRVVGIGRNAKRLQLAADMGAIDSWSTDVESGVQDADLVYIATPVGMEPDFIRRVIPAAKPGCIITDAGSTKGEICRAADGLQRPGISFIGGHPMAGSEAAGVEAAYPDLFVNAAYVLTPTDATPPETLARMRGIAEGIGSRVIVMDPDAHDKCAAIISHLPHLVAASLVLLAQGQSAESPEVLQMIAGSFRDMTRVAASSPVLWRDICLTNVEGITSAVEEFKRILDSSLENLKSGDAAAFELWFAEAKETRDSLFAKKHP